jgi:hypothetical protein
MPRDRSGFLLRGDYVDGARGPLRQARASSAVLMQLKIDVKKVDVVDPVDTRGRIDENFRENTLRSKTCNGRGR